MDDDDSLTASIIGSSSRRGGSDRKSVANNKRLVPGGLTRLGNLIDFDRSWEGSAKIDTVKRGYFA